MSVADEMNETASIVERWRNIRSTRKARKPGTWQVIVWRTGEAWEPIQGDPTEACDCVAAAILEDGISEADADQLEREANLLLAVAGVSGIGFGAHNADIVGRVRIGTRSQPAKLYHPDDIMDPA